MPKAIITRGLPGSGKSTWAINYCKKNKDWIRVSRDDLRRMRGEYWIPKQEDLITFMVHSIASAVYDYGKNLVIDETSLNKHNFECTKNFLVDVIGFDLVEVKDFDVPLEECIKRDLKREHSVGKDVITKMHSMYLREPIHVRKQPSGVPRNIICDIDGTLALFKGNPYNRDFSKDKVNPVVLSILRKYETTHGIILLSGRNGQHKEATIKWLEDNAVPYNFLYMRAEGDFRKDYVVKRELFENHVEPNFSIDFVLDDRNQVVQLWRDLGLTCLQVADGDF